MSKTLQFYTSVLPNNSTEDLRQSTYKSTHLCVLIHPKGSHEEVPIKEFFLIENICKVASILTLEETSEVQGCYCSIPALAHL